MVEVSGQYNRIQNLSPSFKSALAGGYKPNLQSMPDSFESSNLNVNVEKTSFKEIVSGLACLAAYSVLKLFDRKITEVQTKELEPNIEFKKAETYEEAVKFGKEHLGIQKYRGFSKKDVDAINWVNEGLVNVSNYQNGKLKIPDIISYKNMLDSDTSAYVIAQGDTFANVLHINKRHLKNIDSKIPEELKDSESAINLFSDKSMQRVNELIEKYKNNQMTDLKDKMELYHNLRQINKRFAKLPYTESINKMLKTPELRQKLIDKGLMVDGQLKLGKYLPTPKTGGMHTVAPKKVYEILSNATGFKFDYKPVGPFNTVYHEMGHLQYKNISKYGTGDVNSGKEMLDSWKNRNEFATALSVSEYAATCPSEFIAETFAAMVDGEELSDDVKLLFYKYAEE